MIKEHKRDKRYHKVIMIKEHLPKTGGIVEKILGA